MAYSAGMMNKRIKIARRATSEMGAFGKNSAGQKYEILGTFWASETWNKGAKALQAGAMEAYDTVMFRMRYRSDVDRWCLIQYNGRWYEIQSLNDDYQENQLQITAIERVNQQVTIVEPEPEPTASDGSIVGNDENESEENNSNNQ